MTAISNHDLGLLISYDSDIEHVLGLLISYDSETKTRFWFTY